MYMNVYVEVLHIRCICVWPHAWELRMFEGVLNQQLHMHMNARIYVGVLMAHVWER